MLKNKKLIRYISLTLSLLTLLLIVGWTIIFHIWTELDYKAVDFFYRIAAAQGKGPAVSSEIIYLTVTDNTYLELFKKNYFDRSKFADVLFRLSQYEPAAVGIDIIFPLPSDSGADNLFAEALTRLGTAYLPVAFSSSDEPPTNDNYSADKKRMQKYLKVVNEKNAHRSNYIVRSLTQLNILNEAAHGSGHINLKEDSDGIYRHIKMIEKADHKFVPSLTLSMFLDYVEVPLDKVELEWGKEIFIPALADSWLENDIHIPIDLEGRTFVPFPKPWGEEFDIMSIHRLYSLSKNGEAEGNLSELFEGKFVMIGDVSTGISDAGKTPLDDSVPLIVVHAAMLNALLTNNFYTECSTVDFALMVILLSVLIYLSAIIKRAKIFYISGILLLLLVVGFSWFQLTIFNLIPIASLLISLLLMWGGVMISIQVGTSEERAFIKNAFSRYLAPKVVDELIKNPDLLTLRGEEKELTVLFSDIAGFTTISEGMNPQQLVKFLNEYFSEMSEIIISEGGIIDKYQGDSIMALFGTPIDVANNAEPAVFAALKMIETLGDLRKKWGDDGLPNLDCRIGINTGKMVVGNIGSKQVFDYTVIGDSVNLASRLEGINKFYGTHIIISENTRREISDDKFHTRILDVVKVKGKSEAIKIFEVYSLQRDTNVSKNYYQTYQQAFYNYLNKDFLAAAAGFERSLEIRPGDVPSKVLLERIKSLSGQSLPDDWDGSIQFTSK